MCLSIFTFERVLDGFEQLNIRSLHSRRVFAKIITGKNSIFQYFQQSVKKIPPKMTFRGFSRAHVPTFTPSKDLHETCLKPLRPRSNVSRKKVAACWSHFFWARLPNFDQNKKYVPDKISTQTQRILRDLNKSCRLAGLNSIKCENWKS